MIQVIFKAGRGAAAILVAAVLVACDNEIPTATGSDLFPDGLSPTTLQVAFTGSDLVLREEVLTGFGDPRLTPFLIVARLFDGVFSAHPLVDFTGIPDSVTYTADGTTRTEEISAYAGGRVRARVDSLVSFPRSTATLNLYELAQPWDSATVTWEHAVDTPEQRVPWTTPGGTLGNLLATAAWLPGDTATKDSVVWQLDSLEVARLRDPAHPGVVVTAENSDIRLQLSGLTFAGDARPAGKPDTLVELRTMAGVQTFIYNPEAPESPEVIRSGGLTADRTLLTLDLEQTVEACPGSGGPCSQLPLRDVTLNRAQLVFHPVRVPDGHRPLAIPRVQLRKVAEPELGRFAPLGEVLASDTISPAAFASDTEREFALDITSAVLGFQADSLAEVSVMVLTDFAIPDLGLLWFRRSPQLRVVYTLPLNPSLP